MPGARPRRGRASIATRRSGSTRRLVAPSTSSRSIAIDGTGDGRGAALVLHRPMPRILLGLRAAGRESRPAEPRLGDSGAAAGRLRGGLSRPGELADPRAALQPASQRPLRDALPPLRRAMRALWRPSRAAMSEDLRPLRGDLPRAPGVRPPGVRRAILRRLTRAGAHAAPTR